MSLKHKLQIRFVLLSVTSLVILQVLIVGLSIVRNYHQITERADRMISLILSSTQSPEIYDVRYFYVTYDSNNQFINTDTTHTLWITSDQAKEYGNNVITKSDNEGYIGNYRYYVERGNNQTQIIFLSRILPLEAFRNNARSLILVSSICIVVMAFILALISGKVVAPIVNNRQKQKEFITSASHELKTPLTVINADAQLLELEIGENEWLTDIVRQIDRMTQMTHRLVYLARCEEQNGRTAKIDFPISDIAQETAESYKSIATKSHKNYEINIEPHITYCGDENAIRELLTALLDNAFKYSTAQGTIKVLLKSIHHGIYFQIENTIDPKQAEDIDHFSHRFYRSQTGNNVEGFGIGLSVAQAVCTLHKGKLTIKRSKENVIRISAVLK
ncbi:HAMP domain-containing sensor histidine kinase [uncultured Catenibacterium sp.]|uniref:sensor histidine kinase n=1 Tax=uncultured Catenibacterium sp. TaxID=286142 RepID=UPI0025F7AD3A|nr:HAMP domain-containing sensor histidine kinase [uncultured Catenibacterium sp.]